MNCIDQNLNDDMIHATRICHKIKGKSIHSSSQLTFPVNTHKFSRTYFKMIFSLSGLTSIIAASGTQCDPTSSFFGFMGVTAAIVFANLGAAYEFLLLYHWISALWVFIIVDNFAWFLSSLYFVKTVTVPPSPVLVSAPWVSCVPTSSCVPSFPLLWLVRFFKLPFPRSNLLLLQVQSTVWVIFNVEICEF